MKLIDAICLDFLACRRCRVN